MSGGNSFYEAQLSFYFQHARRNCSLANADMPPKMKQARTSDGKSWGINTNPRVVLRPLGDPLEQTCYRFTATAPVASLFKKRVFSDIKLTLGDKMYPAHRLVLCSASQVFAKMLDSNWAESKKEVLELEEEDECVKVFDRFLKYLYSGSIIISENYVIPLFMLADKYDVSALYEECVKVITNDLKVYTASTTNLHMIFTQPPQSPTSRESGSSGSGSDTSESEDVNVAVEEAPQNLVRVVSHPTPSTSSSSNRMRTFLAGCEVFPLAMVVKLYTFCNDRRITEAALYNLEARISNQIFLDNLMVWNELDQQLIISMLEDDHFYCDESHLFKAAKSWLEYDELRQSDAIKAEVLSKVRYPIMDVGRLYEVESDAVVKDFKVAKDLVHEALRYKLFCQLPNAKQQEKWEGKLYQPRAPKN